MVHCWLLSGYSKSDGGRNRWHASGRESNRTVLLYDSQCPGFAVRAYASGAKSFFVDYRVDGRRRKMVLGKFGALTVEEARAVARKKLVEVAKGGDPLAKKTEAKRGETFGALCTLYMDEHSRPHKRSWKDDERRIKKYVVPKIGGRRVRDVTHKDVVALHNRLGQKHVYEANRVMALISSVVEFGRKIGVVSEGHVNPSKGVQKFKEEKRDRWVTPAELPALLEAIEECPHLYVRAALLLYLLTGVRKNELLRARWEDVDLERGELRLPETKSGRTHFLPISTAALDVLRQIPRQADNPHVFPGRNPGGHLVNIQKSWLSIRKAANLEDIRLHDLRRTVGSWLATSGVSLQIVGRILNHSNIATTHKVYAHLANDPIRGALESHGAKIVEIASLRKKEQAS